MLPSTAAQRHGSSQHLPMNNLAALNSMSNLYSHGHNQSQHQAQQLKPICTLQQQHQNQHWATSTHQSHQMHQAQQQRPYFKQETATTISQTHAVNGNNNTIVQHQQDHQYKYNGTLLRDISFSTSMEVESCVNTGNYTNVHYEAHNLANGVGPPNGGNGVPGSQVLFHPNPTNPSSAASGEISGREDSLDLYSIFRDDSYSETSDDFSNESGDNRFAPVGPVVPPVMSSHHEMNFQVQNTNGVPVTNHANHLYGTPYYSQTHHQQSPYNAHQSMMTHAHHQQSYTPQQHHVPVYTSHAANVTAGNHVAYNPEHGLAHHHQYNNMYSKAEYMNGGYTPLAPTATPLSLPSLCTNYTNGLLAHSQNETGLPHPISTATEISMTLTGPAPVTSCPTVTSGQTQSLPIPTNDLLSHNNNIPQQIMTTTSSYTDLNTVTSYTKLEPFSELLQSQVKGTACRNSYTALQQINGREEEDTSNHKDGEGDTETSSGQSEEETATDNFGEIIKKSMVETVSA